jgi:hypothetical protein
LVGKNLEGGIMAQPVRIVGILVAGHDLVEALAEQREDRMLHALIVARIPQPPGQIASESLALIESAQGQETGVTGDLPARKIHADGFGAVEEEGKLCYTGCHALDAPKGNSGFAKAQCSSTF